MHYYFVEYVVLLKNINSFINYSTSNKNVEGENFQTSVRNYRLKILY